MIPPITLLIHGPYAGNAYQEIFSSFRAWKQHDSVDLVIVTYVEDRVATQSSLLEAKIPSDRYSFICVKDLVNPGFFNINRQIVTVRAGVAQIASGRFILKLRNDQWVDFQKLEERLEALHWLEEEREKLVTTNCFTRQDRLYHPSDMFLCAWQPTLKLYYDAPLMKETNVACELGMREKIQQGIPFSQAFICPEIWLFQHYLENKSWKIHDTREDSFSALQRYCYLINSWEIDFRWKKDRTPFKGPGAIILPQYWSWPPFSGMKKENISCYSRGDFDGCYTEEDKKYIAESKILWKRFERDLRTGIGSGGNGKGHIYRKLKTMLVYARKTWNIVKWALPYGIVVNSSQFAHSSRGTQVKAQIKDIANQLIKR